MDCHSSIDLIFLSGINDAHGLALALRQGVLGHEADLRGDEDLVAQLAGDLPAECLEFGVVIDVEVFHLHVYDHGVIAVHGLEGDEVVGGKLLELHQDGLDLDREDVDALEDDHVVAAALHAVEADMVASAGAFTRQDAGQVARAVAQQRHGLTLERGEHELTDLSVGNGLEGVGIDDFDDVVVLPDVHAVLLGALEGNARAAHLRHSEGVVGLDAEHVLDALARIFRMGLSADHERAELRVFAGIDTPLDHHFMQTGSIRRDGVHHGRTEIREELELAQGVAGSRRDGQHANFLGTVLEAEAAGEHAVAGGVLEHVLGAAAHHPEAAGDGVGPLVKVQIKAPNTIERSQGKSKFVIDNRKLQ